MTPVISPWVFYLMSVCGGINVVLTTLLVFGVIATLFFLVSGFVETEDGHNEEQSKKDYKRAKRFGIITAILVTLDILIPPTDTITKMIVAQNVTYERVEAATDVVQTVYEDIMGLFAEGKGEQQAE